MPTDKGCSDLQRIAYDSAVIPGGEDTEKERELGEDREREEV